MRRMLKFNLGILLAGLSAIAAFGPAMAAGSTQIAGEGVHQDVCDDDDIPSGYIMAMSGDLEGCWYNTGYEVTVDTISGVYQERGTETFVGCWQEKCGSFSTTYTFTAKWSPEGSEIRGACQHPIVNGSGTEDFEGITGRVDFKDDVETLPPHEVAIYRGHLKLK